MHCIVIGVMLKFACTGLSAACIITCDPNNNGGQLPTLVFLLSLTGITELTCHSHSLRQTQSDRLPICVVKLCHSLGVSVYLSQEHASAAGRDTLKETNRHTDTSAEDGETLGEA